MQRHRSKSGRGTGRKGQTEIGAVARVVDRAFDDPAATGGLFVLTLTIMAIMSNAMFLQPSSHPKPLFQTRSDPAPITASALDGERASASARDAVPLPRTRNGVTPVVPFDVATPVPTEQAMPAPAVEAMPAAVEIPVVTPVDPHVVLVKDIQRELARIGLYSGAIDGIAGQGTRAAVSRYQAAAGVSLTGELDQNLLSLLTTPSAMIPPAPVGTDPIATFGTAPTSLADLVELERKSLDLEAHARFARVQAALNKIGYGPLTVDGQSGPDTVSAIQRFELDNGLNISGQPSDALIARLVAIGAMAPG